MQLVLFKQKVITMKKALLICFLSVYSFIGLEAQIFGPEHHIICYFTRPVDTSVARTQKAVALIRTAGDSVIAYINRAKYSLDIAMYDFVEDSTWFEQGNIPNIALAINNAYKRGVKIRWICNQIDSAYSPNTGLDSINPAIYHLASPTGSNYGIMHNKYMVIDGMSSNPNDAILWTGCMNWEPGQIDKDANNLEIIQDSGLAHCYLNEFNQMWGDTVEGGKYNLANSKFGIYKKTVPKHHYTVDGHLIDVYFSPTDQVGTQIANTITSAKTEIDFGVFEFSYTPDANAIVTMIKKGLYVAGIMDQYSLQYPAYGTLSNYMGNMLQIYAGSDSLFHNKYVIIDPCNMQADPMVLTGSHNWTTEAENENDESTLVIHDSTVANLFYQEFHGEFYSLGDTFGVGLVQHCIPLGINNLTGNNNSVELYPNPSNGTFTFNVKNVDENLEIEVYNMLGEKIYTTKIYTEHTILNLSQQPSGMYLYKLLSPEGNSQAIGKFVIQ